MSKALGMTRTLFSIFILLALTPPLARADFEADLADTSHTEKFPVLRPLYARARTDDANAQLKMGSVFLTGKEVEQDYAEAMKWFRLAASQGQPQSQFNLGMMYAYGLGVAKDHTKASHWYRLAADQGLAISQLNLGVCYATGSGVPQDNKKAIKWLNLAAKQGEAQAQFNLAVMYATGQGVKQNEVTAIRYAQLAADQGQETAQSLLADLNKKMPLKQHMHTQKSTPKTSAINHHRPPLASTHLYIQLGAFNAQNVAQSHAQKFKAEMRSKLGKIDKPYCIYSSDGWVRLQLGPYASLSEAHHAANRLKLKLDFNPIIKRR
ncbi:MAG: SPOR domain-containing protein [Gallionella sp.]